MRIQRTGNATYSAIVCPLIREPVCVSRVKSTGSHREGVGARCTFMLLKLPHCAAVRAQQKIHQFFFCCVPYKMRTKVSNSKQQKNNNSCDVVEIFLSLHLQLHTMTARIFYEVGVEVSAPIFCIFTAS